MSISLGDEVVAAAEGGGYDGSGRMSQLKTIKQEWNCFASFVFTGKEPDVQVREMEKAFFAGAWSVLCHIRRIGEPDFPEHEGVAHIESIQRECEKFTADMMRRYAEGN